MTHAVLIQAEIDPDSDVEHRRSVLTEFVVPELSQLPGFRKAMWLTDRAGVDTCIATFDAQDQASGALDVLAPSNGPKLIRVNVCVLEMEIQPRRGLRWPPRVPTSGHAGVPAGIARFPVDADEVRIVGERRRAMVAAGRGVGVAVSAGMTDCSASEVRLRTARPCSCAAG